MGNKVGCGKAAVDPDTAWKLQNKEMAENPMYRFVDLARGGKLIKAYEDHGPERVKEIARKEMVDFLYNRGAGGHISKLDYLRWCEVMQAKASGTVCVKKSEDDLFNNFQEDKFNKFEPHEGCWDLSKRGGVGETPFHLCYLNDTPVHFEVGKALMEVFPKLALDFYEGEEYFGESSLHIAVILGDLDAVQLLVKNGANIHQRATGRFFLPEDQKNNPVKETNYNGYCYYGEYPLAFAACRGNEELYDFLIDHGADPNAQDSFGNTVLHMVVIHEQSKMFRHAVRHHKRQARTDILNKQSLTPLTLASKLGRSHIFKDMLDLGSIEFWRFSNTTCSAYPLAAIDSIGPTGETNWFSALMIIVNGETDEHLNMLEGGVIRQLLDDKWKTFARRRFVERLIIAFMHLILLSVAIYTRPEQNLLAYRGAIDAVRYFAEVVVCISCVITVIMEAIELASQGFWAFLKNCSHAPDQTVYLLSCLLILACIPFRFLKLTNVEDILLIMAAPGSWFFLLFFARGFQLTGPHIVMLFLMVKNDLRRFSVIFLIFLTAFSLSLEASAFSGAKLTGPFVTMIYEMLVGDLFRFAIIYCIFLVGFTQGFFFLFRDVASDNSDVAKFSTLPDTILNLFQMTLGEFKYAAFDYSRYSTLTKFVFAIFMILMPILLLNMLIAMMGNTYNQVIAKSEKEWRKQWAKIVVVLERGYSKKQLHAFQTDYSVKLAGPPKHQLGEYCDPGVEQRALVVIKSASKSRAKTIKGAIVNWKKVGKEVVRQMREWKFKKTKAPFVVHKRRGTVALEDMGLPNLTGAVTQLAWEKDINLMASQPSDSASPRSPVQGPSQGQGQQVANGGPRVANGSAVQQAHHHHNNLLSTPTRRPRILEYNRVAPLSLLPPLPKEDSASTGATWSAGKGEDSQDGLRRREKTASSATAAANTNVMALDLKSMSSWGGDTVDYSEETPRPPLSPKKESGSGGFKAFEDGRSSPKKGGEVKDVEAGRRSPGGGDRTSSTGFRDVESGVGVEVARTQSETPSSSSPERSRRHRKKKGKSGKHSREGTPQKSPEARARRSRSPSGDLDPFGPKILGHDPQDEGQGDRDSSQV